MGIKQFPYTLWLYQLAESTYNPSDGSWSDGSEEWVSLCKCRDEANGRGSKIVTEDSEVYVYGAVVYLPKTCPKVPTGGLIRVIDQEGNVRLEGNNRLFKKEQLHARLWL